MSDSQVPRHEDGFTLVELLVAIAILGVLAALAIPSFVGQLAKAEDADATAAIVQLQRNIESCAVKERLDYRECSSAEAAGDGVAWGEGPGRARVVSASEEGYRLEATSRANTGGSSQHRVWLDRQGGVVQRTCAPAGEGGCTADGSW